MDSWHTSEFGKYLIEQYIVTCNCKIIKTARGATSAPCLRISEQCVVVCAAGRVLCILLNLNLFIDV